MNFKNSIIGAVALLLISITDTGSVVGQEVASPLVQASALSLTATDVATFSSLSDVQMENLVNTLAATPTLSVDALPLNGRAGTFYSLQNPNWPPLPCDTSGSAVWSISGGAYLLNDLDFSYDVAPKQSLAKGGVMHMMDFSPPSFSESSGTNTPDDTVMPPVNYGTNLWIAQARQLSGYLVGIATNSQADVLYEIQSKQDLLQSNWLSEGFVYGSELTNWTALAVAQGNRTNLFLRIRSWIDSTGSGIPDWWWLAYFGQVTNVDATVSAAGDGFSNLQKFQMGLNPTNYYNPNPPPGFFGCLDASGTNAFIEWSNAPGPVVNYTVQRGVYNTGTSNYVYSQVALLSSNATFYEDVGAITNDNAQNNIYNLTAVYPHGSLSATDTWQVWWYLDDGSFGPPYGPPMPGNVYAHVDAAGTNVIISWTPAAGAATNYLIERGIYDPTNYVYDYYPIGHVSPGTTNFEVFGAVTNDADWTEAYQISAVYAGGGLSTPVSTVDDYSSFSSINVGAYTNSPAAPGNFYGYADASATNVFLTWNSVSGAVTNYLVYGGVIDPTTDLIIYHRLGQTGAGTNSFKVVGGIDSSGNNLYTIYNVVAVYTNGSLSQSAAWYSSAGAPAPSALYAWLDATGTNVQLSWSAATGAVTGYLIQRSDYGQYSQSWDWFPVSQVNASTTSLADTNAVGHGYFELGSTIYEVQAMYANGGLSPAATALVTNLPAGPTGLSVVVDATGTNVLISWNAALGGASGYIILRGTYSASTGTYGYAQIGSVGAGTTSFQDTGIITGNNSNNNLYEVEAVYPGGRVSLPNSAPLYTSPATTYNLSVTAQMVRNATGRWQLMFSAIPTNVTAVQLYIAPYYYEWDTLYLNSSLDYFNNQNLVDTIPVSSLTNGLFVIPDSITTNEIGDNQLGRIVGVQPLGTANHVGKMALAGFLPFDAPCFVDGRQHLKQNLLFELRGATIGQPVGLAEHNVWFDPFYTDIDLPADTNYVESSFFHYGVMFKAYNNFSPSYIEMDDLWPFTVNYDLHGRLYDTNYTGPSSFVWSNNLVTIPAAAVLGVSDPYWTFQFNATYVFDPATGVPITSLNSATLASVAAYTNSGSLYLQSGYHNLFGLSFATALVNIGGYAINPANGLPWISSVVTLATGSSISLTNVSSFYSQTADPSLQAVSYYFAPVNTPGTALPGDTTPDQLVPLPMLPGFASTNQTGIMVASVGNPTVIGGWAKYSIQNGSSNKFAYLGQYFVTNAFLLNANGMATTNRAGIVSPYGDFFPTQAGAAALVTMPDIDTGVQATGLVRVISLNVDANHDGIMNFNYASPDFVSASKPFRFWVNDDADAGDYGGDGVPGSVTPDGTTPIQVQNTNVPFLSFNSIWSVHGRRDLVDFFPVCLNIGGLFQSNALSAGISVTDTNYQFVLSHADGALRFTYTDLTPTNYMNFLQDTNESGVLASAPLTTITAGGVALTNAFLRGIATNNQSVILVEAWTNTTQPLVLTIYHGTNLIAQTSLALSVSGVEQMFRHKNLLLSASPAMPDRLTDADVPNEPDTGNQNFIFVHGYNVNPQQARGWDADIYKRLYWSGSHAKFYGVTWEASDSQVAGQVTINLQTNIVNAFNTAPSLNTFLNSLSGINVVAAHSLGNMLVLSTLNDCTNHSINTYFMIDAAVAIEAIDGGATPNPDMFPTAWTNYQSRLWSSQWHNLFPTNDARSTLTWSNRLANLQNAEVYNFYSSGEEVLRDYPADPPANLLTIAYGQGMGVYEGATGVDTWVWQEKLKGLLGGDYLLSSSHGGWKFAYAYYSNNIVMPSTQAALLPDSALRTNAFFEVTSSSFGNADLALFGSSGSSYAQANRNRILSDAIPCLTLPAGANHVSRLAPFGQADRNTDMMALENGWPQCRLETSEGNNWHHSDCRAVAYTFTYQLFNQMATIGNLK